MSLNIKRYDKQNNKVSHLGQKDKDKPLWLADDYGDCSNIAIVGITEDLKLITKQTD